MFKFFTDSARLMAWLNYKAMFYETLIEKKKQRDIILLICVTNILNVVYSTSFKTNICEQRLKERGFASLT